MTVIDSSLDKGRSLSANHWNGEASTSLDVAMVAHDLRCALQGVTGGVAVLEKAAGASADQIERVRKASIELGRDADLPGLSAADAADAFRILAVSGIDVETALGGAARATLQLSRASKVEATDAAKSVASGINVFGLAGDKAQVVLLRHEHHLAVGIVEVLIDHRPGDEIDMRGHAGLGVER